MPLINEDEFSRPNDQFRRSPFNDVGAGMSFDPNHAGVEYAESRVDTPEPEEFVGENAIGPDQIAPGAVGPIALDTTPPATPSDLAVTSAVGMDSDGHAALRLIVSLTQPGDSDLYGSYVDITATPDSGDPNLPDFTYSRSVFIPANATRAVIDGALGNTRYWVRARAADIQGNLSGYVATVDHTTAKDNVAPPLPVGLQVVAAYRGVMANWNPLSVQDLMFIQVQYAPDDGAGNPNEALATTIHVRTSGVFIGNLDPATLYWFRIRSVDTSGNVQTSDLDPTALDYQAEPDAGWTPWVSAQPTMIGAADVAFNSVLTSILAANEINADDIRAGTFRVSPLATDAEGIEILAADLTVIGRWDENGLKIVDPTDPARFLLIESGEVRFTTDNGGTFPLAITPEGINASAINFGALPGGHNLIVNSSFELSGFVAAASSFTFTSATEWAAANRVTALANISEGASLVMTTPGYV